MRQTGREMDAPVQLRAVACLLWQSEFLMPTGGEFHSSLGAGVTPAG